MSGQDQVIHVMGGALQLLQSSGLTPLAPVSLWDREDLTSEQLLLEYQAECRIVRQGINGDLTKVQLNPRRA